MDSVNNERRVYKFLSAPLALDDLTEQHIKISTFPDMNDPFELTGGLQCDPEMRGHLAVLLSRLNEWCGVLCFSQDWQHAMLWSHYAAKHAGMCIGFDVSSPMNLKDPHYVTSRREIDTGLRTLLAAAARMDRLTPSDLEACNRVTEQLLLTKFDAWRYENEVRAFVELKREQQRGDYYFAEFDDHLRPRLVILGPRCTTAEGDIEAAIRGYSPPITVVRTMLSPDSFQVIEKKIGPIVA
jgi:hypothetical protein